MSHMFQNPASAVVAAGGNPELIDQEAANDEVMMHSRVRSAHAQRIDDMLCGLQARADMHSFALDCFMTCFLCVMPCASAVYIRLRITQSMHGADHSSACVCCLVWAMQFEDFYEEVFEELSKFGTVEEMNVCDNLGDHLVGNVYVKVR
jgi:hypothetical protein